MKKSITSTKSFQKGGNTMFSFTTKTRIILTILLAIALFSIAAPAFAINPDAATGRADARDANNEIRAERKTAADNAARDWSCRMIAGVAGIAASEGGPLAVLIVAGTVDVGCKVIWNQIVYNIDECGNWICIGNESDYNFSDYVEYEYVVYE